MNERKEIGTIEELKENIESILRDMKNLLEVNYGTKTIEENYDDLLEFCTEEGWIVIPEINSLFGLLSIFINNKPKLHYLANELLVNVREAVLWQRMLDSNIMDIDTEEKGGDDETGQPESINS